MLGHTPCGTNLANPIHLPMSRFRIPTATYRLQLNDHYRFADATAIVDYLHRLGISDIYSSPILKANPGSQHGYDVVSATEVNPELGSEEDLGRLSQELSRRDMGFLLDVVPNHMAASLANLWWRDVLENGRFSRYADTFDIEWSPFTARGNLENKVLLPILGKPYGEVLESKELKLELAEEGLVIRYFERKLPVAFRAYEQIIGPALREDDEPTDEGSLSPSALHEILRSWTRPGERPETAAGAEIKKWIWERYERRARFRERLAVEISSYSSLTGMDRLDALHDLQWYRLAYWRMASEEINYRRFFDITDLIGVRVEDPSVFEMRHAKIFQLIGEGTITGLRIDHIDGLYNPVTHLKALQRRLGRGEEGSEPAFYVVVEKILGREEPLRDDFACRGTTGYESLSSLNNVFVSAEGLDRLSKIYARFSSTDQSFETIVYQRKKRAIEDLFAGDLRSLGARLIAIAASHRNARDFSSTELPQALVEVTASLDVYRTYISDFSVTDEDRRRIEVAISTAARRSEPRLDIRVYWFLRDLLLLRVPVYLDDRRNEWLDFVMRWQQFTGRVMAKGVEDTAFYVYNRLLSMNEVGGDPAAKGFRDGREEFHAHNLHLLSNWPDTMNASSTHDTKRSEDMRARISVLSEMPDLWERKLRRWSKANAGLLQKVGEEMVPDLNEQVHFYQTLLGVWPLDESEMKGVADRVKQYAEKALREAKVHTSWLEPKAEYEDALKSWIDAILSPELKAFMTDFLRFQKKIAYYGFFNALSQVVLKAAAPGVPDFYQGMELWNFSMVDPDNRRPVDFETRDRILQKLEREKLGIPLSTKLLSRWRDGRIKMFVTWKVLELRRRWPDLFRRGDYVPLVAEGKRQNNICAFARRDGARSIIVVVPRMLSEMISTREFPLGDVWEKGRLLLPDDSGAAVFRNIFTEERVEAAGGSLRLQDVFASFPVAVLESAESPGLAPRADRPIPGR